jgi:flagellar biosynthesis GTPase FlhF
MSSAIPRSLLRIRYEEAAEAYLQSLPPEHHMEGTAQATQRKITVCSFEIVHADRPDLQLFNELLVQYPFGPDKVIRQVVPDNMLIRHDELIDANGSFDVPFQPARPFWMMEYVSKRNKRKDYEDSFDKYERELKVPYYLLFYPDNQEVTLYRHNGRKYVSVKPNEHDRYAVAEVDIELGLLDGWVRYWFKGSLLPLPADLLRKLEEVSRQLAEATRLAKREKRRADKQEHRAEEEARRAEEQTRRAEEQTRRAEEEARRAEEQTRRAEEQTRRAEEQARRAEEEAHRAEQERQGRLAAEQELVRLREQMARLHAEPPQGQ